VKQNKQNLIDDDLVHELTPSIVGVVVLTIARMIRAKKIDPSKLKSNKKLVSIVDQLGRTNDNAFEIHTNRIPEKIATIRACVDGSDPESAVILLYTLIEGEVNTVIRILLRIHGYSHSAITNAIRGIDFKSKLDIVLPLMGVDLSPRIRQLALESQAIRNASVHFKALPTSWSDSGNREGDYDTILDKAMEFLGRNSIDSIEIVLAPFVDACISQCQEVQLAFDLLHRFKTNTPKTSSNKECRTGGR
jgi:hypothetical protein